MALDVRTGAALMMYSPPTFDPSQLASSDANAVSDALSTFSLDPSSPLLNRAISEHCAPGSMFKILTAIALTENGLADPDVHTPPPVPTTLPGTATGVSSIESPTCGDGEPTPTEAFTRSCNTTFVLAFGQLINQQPLDVTNRFDFGCEPQIPPTIAPSVLSADADAAQLAMSSIDQYMVRMTPLQMAQVARAIANDGQVMIPYLIDSIADVDNQVARTNSPIDAGKPISSETASKLRAMVESVISQPYGTGTTMALPNITMAVKTGITETDNGGHANTWAVGFAPADSLHIASAVLAEGNDNDPTPHGGGVVGPVARALLETGLQQVCHA